MLPTDFDVPGLDGFQPAAFIATPILKVVEPTLPGLGRLSPAMLQALGLFPRQAAAISMAANGWPSRSIPPA